ncbi:phosphopantothenoylcysteine decarboxylase isoform X2 [Bombina bombina]|uniref:phosphopantothenoylcysteine decarboxylase isoform X2 n=1 Tax=Bombina bombina TaxID=8345 RepID=UPI00235AFBA4|nr:phosphopantothenoylcysteine decarboxylase isoform X2 [Bombina bombina]
MEKKWEEVFNFLSVGVYPSGYNKSQKLNLRRHASKFTIKDGELFFGSRRAIKTKEEARMLFTEFHSPPFGGHSGIVKTRTAMCAKFYWHGMTIDVDSWVLECDKCQKVGKNLTASQQFTKVSTIWQFVGIDLTGPFPKTVDGFEYILIATDYFSKWVEAFPLKSKSAAEVGHHICSIIYRHGCPKRILSDEGTEFVNELNYSLGNLLGIERSVIAAYNPQTNCVDKKTNDNIKRALTKLFNEKQNNWDVYLDATLFSLRSKVNTTTKHSPFLLMYGREAVLPSEVPVDMPDSPPMQVETLCLFPEGRPHSPDPEPKCKVSEMDVLPDSSEQEVKEELPSFLDSEATVSNTNCEMNVLVGVTGSVAALKLPLLVSGLLQIPGVQVQVVSTENAKHFYHEHGLGVPIYSDKDEWEVKRCHPKSVKQLIHSEIQNKSEDIHTVWSALNE